MINGSSCIYYIAKRKFEFCQKQNYGYDILRIVIKVKHHVTLLSKIMTYEYQNYQKPCPEYSIFKLKQCNLLQSFPLSGAEGEDIKHKPGCLGTDTRHLPPRLSHSVYSYFKSSCTTNARWFTIVGGYLVQQGLTTLSHVKVI